MPRALMDDHEPDDPYGLGRIRSEYLAKGRAESRMSDDELETAAIRMAQTLDDARKVAHGKTMMIGSTPMVKAAVIALENAERECARLREELNLRPTYEAP